MQEELEHNVFLRCHDPLIQRHCGTAPSRPGGGVSEGPARSNGDAGGGEGAAEQRSGHGRGEAAEVGAGREAGQAGQGGSGEGGPGGEGPSSGEGGANAGSSGCGSRELGGREEPVDDAEVAAAIRTLAELRRLKDNHGGVARLVTAVVNAGRWLGLTF